MPELSVILPFIIGVVVLYIVLKILSFPIKVIIKLVVNAVIGGALIWIINYVGASFAFSIPLEWWSALLVGILGIPGAIILAIFQLFV